MEGQGWVRYQRWAARLPHPVRPEQVFTAPTVAGQTGTPARAVDSLSLSLSMFWSALTSNHRPCC